MAEDKSAEILANNKAILQVLIAQRAEAEAAVDLAKAQANIAKNRVDALSDIDKLQNGLVKTLVKAEKQLQNQYKLDNDILQGLKDQKAAIAEKIIMQRRSGQLSIIEARASFDELKNIEDLIKAQDALANLNEADISRHRKLLDLLGESTSQLDEFIDRYVPMGKTLSKFLGLNSLQVKLQKAHTSALEAFNKELADSGNLTEATSKAMAAFRAEAAVIAGPLIMLAIVAALVLAATLAASLEKQFAGIAKEAGITVAQAEALAKSSQEVANQLGSQLITMGDVLAVQKATIKEFGTMAMMTPEIAAEVASIGEAFGYGADEAAKVNNALLGLGVPAAEAADAQLDLAAAATKAGVSVGTVTADIAASAKETAKFFGGNVKALTRAAVEAAKLGVSLTTMVNVSKSLLDIESSLANQYEFMALTGKEVNFDLARQLALQGDIAGATKLILDQMGGIDEFNQMDVLQKEAAAKAAGMSVDELSKSLAIQDALGNATEDQLAAAQGLGLSAAEIQSMNKEDLKARLAQEQSAKDLSAGVANLGNELKMIVLPIGQAVLTVLQTMTPVLKLIGGAIKLAFLPLLFAATLIEEIVQQFRLVGDLITGNTEGMSEMQMVFSGILGLVTAITIATQGYNAVKRAGRILDIAEAGHLSMIIKNKYLLSGIETVIAAKKRLSNSLESKGLIKTLQSGAAMMMKAVASIFTTFAGIPFGLGIPIAIAAVGGLFALGKKAYDSIGDMNSPADGRTQISTKEGGLFQLSKNDDVLAGPGLSGAMAGGGTASTASTGGSTDMSTTNALLNQLVTNISALSNRPVQIKIGDRVVDEIKAQADINSTYVVG
jgi:hypothetical protein